MINTDMGLTPMSLAQRLLAEYRDKQTQAREADKKADERKEEEAKRAERARNSARAQRRRLMALKATVRKQQIALLQVMAAKYDSVAEQNQAQIGARAALLAANVALNLASRRQQVPAVVTTVSTEPPPTIDAQA